jgi:Tol biopolymer transport system component
VNEPVRLMINPPPGAIFSGAPNTTFPAPQLAVSPDGRAIVFAASIAGGPSMLWMRSMDELTSRLLPGTEDPEAPFWSPDSRWVVFFSGGKLKKTPAVGGSVQVLATVRASRGACWGPNDTLLVTSGNAGLFRMSSAGGPLTAVTQLDQSKDEGTHRWPQFLPDGRHFLYLIRSAIPEHRGIYAGSIDGKIKKLLIPIDSNVAYAQPGYLLYTDGDMLLAQAFDAGRLELSGQPFAVAERVGHATQGAGAFSVSAAGVLAYAGPILHPGRIAWFDRDGKELGSVMPDGDYIDFRLSPDQQQLVASRAELRTGVVDTWLTDLPRGSVSRFTFGPLVNASAVWSPDGKRIVFRAVRRGVAELFQRSASGGGAEERVLSQEIQREVLTDSNVAVPTDWSSDGQHLLFSTLMSTNQLWVLPLVSAGGDGKPYRFVDSPGDQMHGNFSPDGRLVAYSSNESGRLQVLVQTFPPSDRKWQVSTAGGFEPRWRGDGRELYYLTEDRKLMAVAVNSGPSFGVPEFLFQTNVVPGVNAQRMGYVPSRDGRRFLINRQTGDPPLNPITVVLNWNAWLKK